MARITGKDGALYLGGSKVADVYDVTIELTTDLAECTVKGSAFADVTPGASRGRITGRRRVNFSALLAKRPLDSSQGISVSYQINLIDPSAAFTQVSGNGFVESGTLSVPFDDSIDDQFTLVMTSTPTWTTPGVS